MKSKKPNRCFLFLVIGVLALALSGCAKAPKPVGIGAPTVSPSAKTTEPPAPTPASQNDIQSAITKAMNSDTYRQGGKYLKAAKLPSDYSSDAGQSFAHRSAVDLARSITAEQYKLMKKNHQLLYSDLTAEQQSLLDRLLKAFPNLLGGGKVQDSFISFYITSRPDGSRHLLMSWSAFNNGVCGGSGFSIN
jgi:hypothetical protein